MQIPLNVLYAVARRCPVKIIAINEKPYLERFFLGETKKHTFYLHRMLAPDGDRDLHNHPWRDGYSIILHGKYTERRLEFGFRHRDIKYIAGEIINTVRRFYYFQTITKFNHLSEFTWHTIAEIQEPETWTLFWHSAWIRHWGFLRATGFEDAAPHKTDSVESSRWWERPDCPRGKDVMYGLQGKR